MTDTVFIKKRIQLMFVIRSFIFMKKEILILMSIFKMKKGFE